MRFAIVPYFPVSRHFVPIVAAAFCALAVAAAGPFTPTAAAATPRACGDTGTGPGGAIGVRAIGVSCKTAKSLMRRCLKGERIGWKQRATGRTEPNSNSPIIEFRKGKARIYAAFVGAGGCSG